MNKSRRKWIWISLGCMGFAILATPLMSPLVTIAGLAKDRADLREALAQNGAVACPSGGEKLMAGKLQEWANQSGIYEPVSVSVLAWTCECGQPSWEARLQGTASSASVSAFLKALQGQLPTTRVVALDLLPEHHPDKAVRFELSLATRQQTEREER